MQRSDPFHRFTIGTANYLPPANALKQTIYIRHFSNKTKKYLQYITIIRINLFESKKNFTSAVAINFRLIFINFK